MELKFKPKVLVFIDWFLPGYKAGGPIKSVANIINALSDTYEFVVVTSNRDAGNSKPYTALKHNRWLDIYNARIIYLTPNLKLIGMLRNIVRKEAYKVVYFNSLFSVRYTLIPIVFVKWVRPCVKIVLAPRGMLGDGALQIKPFKKQLFIFASKWLGLFNNVVWHASSAYEAQEIYTAFSKKPNVVIAPNITLINDLAHQQRTKNTGEAKFFFLSRISEKKNLLGAIKMLQQLPIGSDAISLDIIGPIEDENYWQNCTNEINKITNGVKIKLIGSIPNHELEKYLPNYHFMLFPTFNENYGHVVVESLSAGCPVIISDQTPWRNLQIAKIGWDLSLKQPQNFVDAIKQAVAMPQNVFDEWSQSSIDYVTNYVCSPEIIQKNRELFNH
jgi:glycosyltransferase involved in cell wall biosynthesis